MDELVTARKLINTYLGLIFKIGLVLIILSTLFLFANLTTEIYDTPKFIVLLVLSGVLLVLLTLKFTLLGKVVLTRTPLDLPLLLLLAVGIVGTVLAPAPFVSLLGNQLRVHGSLVSLIAYILFYFILVNYLKGIKEIKWILAITVVAGQILAIITLLSYAGVKLLPPPLSHGLNFTTTGASFSTTAILALLLPVILMQILSSNKPALVLLNSLCLLLSGITIALTGTWATWIAGLAGIILTFFVFNPVKKLNQINPVKIIGLIIPLVLIALVAVLSFMPPIGGTKNPIYAAAQKFPREIQLPFVASWKIAASSFRDFPFWGSGPGTFVFDFTNYKPVEFNSSKFWNLRFDTAFNEYFQALATLGGVGLAALLFLTAFFASSAIRTLKRVSTESHLPAALAISGLIFFIILSLHSSTLPLWVLGLVILASFMKANLAEAQKSWSNASGDIKNMFLKIAANVTSGNSSEETIKVDALPGVILVISLALVLFTFFFGGKFVLADYHHRLALNAVGANQGIVAYNELIAAEKLNPYNDLYRTDLAQTNFALANAIATAKGPTEASPAGSFTDQDKQNIQVLLSQSINEAKTAVAINPKSATNWEILALLYRQISGVAQNALVFSLDSYGRAIFQDPFNPALRVSVGGVYYAVKNYDMAIRFFTDAINLKPDFANAYYNLSVALKDKGDLAGAKAMAEKVLTLVEKDSADYKTVNDYLTDLNSKIASGTQDQTQTVPPAAQDNTALQEKQLPKVIDLPKPEKIATPEAIKKPAATPTPGASVTPSPIPTEASTPTPSPTP